MKEKLIYFPRLCKPWISDAIIISNYFVSIRMALLPLIVIIILKKINNYSTILLMQEIIISRENSQSARIIQATPGRLKTV